MTTVHESRLTQKGQIYLPREARERLGLGPRDRVRLEVDDDGIHIRPADSRGIGRWGGAFRHPAGTASWTDVKDAFEQGVADDVMARIERA